MKKDKINIKMGYRLRTIREDNGFQQYEFADLCGISEAYYGRLERGEYSPTIKALEKISRTLGISISELVKDIDWQIKNY